MWIVTCSVPELSLSMAFCVLLCVVAIGATTVIQSLRTRASKGVFVVIALVGGILHAVGHESLTSIVGVTVGLIHERTIVLIECSQDTKAMSKDECGGQVSISYFRYLAVPRVARSVRMSRSRDAILSWSGLDARLSRIDTIRLCFRVVSVKYRSLLLLSASD